jgi:predicted RNA-binding protein YlqC (UPF0109 family)
LAARERGRIIARLSSKEVALERVRIVLVGMPEMLREITRNAIHDEPWAEIVAEYDAPVPISDAARANDANVVLVGDSPEVDAEANGLLDDARQLAVLALTDDGRQTVLYELRPHKVPLGEISPGRLVDAIRTAVSAPVEA